MQLKIKPKENLNKDQKQKNHIKHYTYSDKGITLIALIITIIVLLILAGVSIATLTGENGILKKASEAKDKTQIADVIERVQTDILGLETNNGQKISKEELRKILEKYFEEVPDPLPDDLTTLTLKSKQKYGGQKIEVSKIYNGGLIVTAESITADEYGAYVNYGIDINNNGKTDDDWKIFYKDSEDRIFLIAADYVPDTCKALTDSTAKAKMTQSGQLGKECCYRWANSSAAEYHCNDNHNKSLNNLKAQCSFLEIFMPNEGLCTNGTHYYCSDHVGNDGTGGDANARCASALQCTENWRPFIDGSTKRYCADYAIGGPTLEMWVASWNEKHGNNSSDVEKKELYANGNGNYGYYVGAQEQSTDPNATFTSATGYNDELYFPHKEQDNLNLDKSGTADADTKNQNCDGYWLASPAGDNPNKMMMVFAYGGMKGATITVDRGFRPIVCLKSNVRLTKRENTETEANKVVYDIQMPNV